MASLRAFQCLYLEISGEYNIFLSSLFSCTHTHTHIYTDRVSTHFQCPFRAQSSTRDLLCLAWMAAWKKPLSTDHFPRTKTVPISFFHINFIAALIRSHCTRFCPQSLSARRLNRLYWGAIDDTERDFTPPRYYIFVLSVSGMSHELHPSIDVLQLAVSRIKPC